MGLYRHLSREDREEIAVLRAAGHSNAGIAVVLGRSPSTISRELRRNALDTGRYSAHTADGAYLLRRQRNAVLEAAMGTLYIAILIARIVGALAGRKE